MPSTTLLSEMMRSEPARRVADLTVRRGASVVNRNVADLEGAGVAIIDPLDG